MLALDGRDVEDGYGFFNVMGELPTGLAHRIAWLLLRGDIPDGLVIDHLCRNRWCVNPWHMDPVPLWLNTLRGNHPSAVARRTNQCRRGHEFTGENTYRLPDGTRRCRTCVRLRVRARKAETRAA